MKHVYGGKTITWWTDTTGQTINTHSRTRFFFVSVGGGLLGEPFHNDETLYIYYIYIYMFSRDDVGATAWSSKSNPFSLPLYNTKASVKLTGHLCPLRVPPSKIGRRASFIFITTGQGGEQHFTASFWFRCAGLDFLPTSSAWGIGGGGGGAGFHLITGRMRNTRDLFVIALYVWSPAGRVIKSMDRPELSFFVVAVVYILYLFWFDDQCVSSWLISGLIEYIKKKKKKKVESH